MAKCFLYMKTHEKDCAPKHNLWKIFICWGQDERHSKMKVIISLGIHCNGAVPPSHFFPLFVLGYFPAMGLHTETQNHPSGRCPAAASSTLSQSSQSRPIPSVVLLLPGQSCTSPSSWEVALTSPGTEVEIKVAAKIASTGTVNTTLIANLCISTSWWQFLELLRPLTLTNI